MHLLWANHQREEPVRPKERRRTMRKRSKREQYKQERHEILAVNVNILDIRITSEISPEESENGTYYIN